MKFASLLLRASGSGFDREELEGLLSLLDGKLSKPHSVSVIGGAVMVLKGVKPRTGDVDCTSTVDPELAQAALEVSREAQVAPDWLNHSAAGFLVSDVPEAQSETLWAGERLTLTGPSEPYLFFMKAQSARYNKDLDDVLALVRHLGWDAKEAEAQYRSMSGGSPMPQNVFFHIRYSE